MNEMMERDILYHDGIASHLKYTKYFDGLYSGQKEIVNKLLTIWNCNGYVPTFEYICGGMVVTMFRRTFKEIGTLNGTLNEPLNEPLKLSELERSIINIFIENPVITREELSEKMKVSIRTIQRALDELKKKKLIMRIGSKKSGKWLVDKKGTEA